ncbi:MAG: hypothetical protein QF467_02845 [SAR202 cluster bacterium]|jgi:hypothetical protein|nr:hypothetical protein [SAR202 cluster bacterium]
MGANSTVEVHLYGKLRRVAEDCQDMAGECALSVDVDEDSTIANVVTRLGLDLEETSNIFLNGQLSAPTRTVAPGDRLGVFPSDMATLYKWYFAKQE